MHWDPATGEVDPTPSGVVPDGSDRNRARFGQKFAASRDGKLVARTADPRAMERSLSRRGQDYASTAVEIREAATGRLLHTLLGHSAEITTLLFSPDGRRLVTGSSDFTIKLWDTATGREVFTLRGHTGGVACLAFSPDGLRLASGSMDPRPGSGTRRRCPRRSSRSTTHGISGS
jgi:WD40 repeat protein